MIWTFVCLALADLLALWAVIKTEGWWQLRVVGILAAAALNFAILSQVNSGSGWPVTSTSLPPSVMVSCDPVEPSPLAEGAVYFWVDPLKFHSGWLGFKISSSEPESFRLPYSRALERACDSAKKQQQAGEPVFINTGKKAPHQNGHGHHSGPPDTHVRFYRNPPSSLLLAKDK